MKNLLFPGKIIIILALALSVGFLSSQVFAAEMVGGEKQTVRVGYTDYGMMIRENNGQFSGYGIEYLQMLSHYVDLEFEYIEVSEENRIRDLIDGRIDLLCDLSEDGMSTKGILVSVEQSGLFYGLLCAEETDERFFFEEYEAFNGKRIAVNRSRNMQEMLREFALDHDISYQPVYCNSFEEMEAAVEEGRADLMLASNQRDLKGYKYVAKAGVRNQYFAVSEDRPELMELLNYADRQMKLKQPFIIGVLYDKYYGRPNDVLTGMTRQEYELIQSGEAIRVVCDANSYPVEYVDKLTGEYKGIYADALRLIEKESGLTFEFIPLERYREAWEMLRNEEADMAAGMYVNDALAKEYRLSCSQSYVVANYTMIAKEGNALESITQVALPENYVGILSYVANTYPSWEVIKGRDVEECLKLIEQGKADGTLVNSIFLQTVYNVNNYSGLAVYPLYSAEIPISCTFAGEKAELLTQIINKAIKRIPEESFQNCIIENSVSVAYKPGLKEILREAFPILFGLIVAIVAIYLIMLWFREKHYRHMAMTDSVTGLWNGVCFRERAGDEIARNYTKEYLMVSLDMEHFKYVNNDFGEKAADSVLVVIAQRLRELFGKEALYAREMGDCFLILTRKREDIEKLLLSLTEEIEFEVSGVKQHYKPVLKFGICPVKAGKKEVEIGQFIDAAVLARKTIKRNHRGQIAYYDDHMEAETKIEARIERRMEAALKDNEFTVYYQPKYLLDTEEIIGAEALVRWNDPNEGLVSPGSFIPIFERNGFIIQLDFFVYEETIKLLSRRIREGKRIVPVSVNVSRIHIATGDFLKKLIELTEKYGLPRKLIELELTETTLGGKQQNTVEFIRECKDAGFAISIDDFGSGYSSLNLLKELPVDVLKIDREFLNELEESPKSSIILNQVVEMASKIDIKTLCEGVETKKQAEFLRQIGCNMVQGYLYSRPVQAEKFEALLNA